MLIDPEDSKWGFTLKPLAGNKPTFEFRAETEPERVQWVTAFVSACLLAADEDQFDSRTKFPSGSADLTGLSSSFFESVEEEDDETWSSAPPRRIGGASEGRAAGAMMPSGNGPEGATTV